MERAIDASELMAEIQVCSWDSEQDRERAEDLVLGMPTLTPPNEALICDGCLWAEMGALEKCSSCMRDKKDNYYRRQRGILGKRPRLLRHGRHCNSRGWIFDSAR